MQDFAGLSVGKTAVISLTIERDQEAFRLLSDAGYRVIASEHLLVRLEKHPGALAELSRRLAEENVNVRGMHIVNKDETAGIVALETVDYEKAREVLKDILVSVGRQNEAGRFPEAKSTSDASRRELIKRIIRAARRPGARLF